MKAVVFHGIGDIRLDDVKKPRIKGDSDAIIKITTSAICGTDLHFIRGTVGPMKNGTILGHEAVGIVESLGREVRNLLEGERVIIPSTIACGYCPQCRNGHFSQCDEANPNGPEYGTAFFGGTKDTGPIEGCQAEYVRVPFASHNLVKLSSNISDDEAILLSDYFGADIAAIKPVEVIKEATNGMLADVVIDAVGVDAESSKKLKQDEKEFKEELKKIAPKTNIKKGNWIPGNAPSSALKLSVDLVKKCGTISIIGVYAEASNFPIGKASEKNIKIVTGNCPHRYYIPKLLNYVQAGIVRPTEILTQVEPLVDVIEAYKQFDLRSPGWIKVALKC